MHEQNGVVSVEDQLQTLLGSLPAKFDILRESYFSQTPAPNITYLWTRMLYIAINNSLRTMFALDFSQVRYNVDGDLVIC